MCVTRTSRFDFGYGQNADLAYLWDTKHKLFHLAEVCALDSVVPVVVVKQIYLKQLQKTVVLFVLEQMKG